jgi:hypothetical protein
MFPSVIVIPKQSAEDTSLSTINSSGERVTVPVPKGTAIHLNVVGLHYNRKCVLCSSDNQLTHKSPERYWEDPYEFKPDRFRSEWHHDAFLPFSGGLLGHRVPSHYSDLLFYKVLEHV